jgi:phosphoribosylanthranilate isomerase
MGPLAGMIMWQGSKRAVDTKTAAAIAAVARDSGAVPVGVFVSENADAIADACEVKPLFKHIQRTHKQAAATWERVE